MDYFCITITSTLGLVAMTSASHAEVYQFNPGWVYCLSVLLSMLHEIRQLTNGFFGSNSFLWQDCKSFWRLVDPKVGSRQRRKFSWRIFAPNQSWPAWDGLNWKRWSWLKHFKEIGRPISIPDISRWYSFKQGLGNWYPNHCPCIRF